MKKTLKKFTCIVMVIVSLLSVGASTTTAFAQKEENQFYSVMPLSYKYISTCTAGINISGIKAQFSANLVAATTCDLRIKIEFQKKKSTGYETLESFYGSKRGTSLVVTGERNINILCDYRIRTTFTAGSDSVVTYDYPS